MFIYEKLDFLYPYLIHKKKFSKFEIKYDDKIVQINNKQITLISNTFNNYHIIHI